MRALLPLALSALASSALGQSFVDGAGQLPTTPSSNNSSTENLDWADVDLDGDFDALANNIHAKLFTLPDDTQVLPGHGPPTSVGHEKRENPFVGAPSGYKPR